MVQAPPVTTLADPLRRALQRLAERRDLDAELAAEAFGVVMRGEATTAQVAALLMGLRVKGETAAEVAGAVRALRAAMVRLDVADRSRLVDTCGTGGGAVGTLNISTGAAFIAAGAGVPVAKHGNRSFTSRSGSADVIEALGVRLALQPARAAEVLARAGIVFLFAPDYHPAMRHAGPARRELGLGTIMNLVGPLANPAGVERQVVGVADPGRAALMAHALAALGSRHALVVHAQVGMDEISPVGATDVLEVLDGAVRAWTIDPREHGLAMDSVADLAGGGPEENARRLERLLAGEERGAARNALLLNAAAALFVAGEGYTFGEALERAMHALAGGAALAALERLRAESGAA